MTMIKNFTDIDQSKKLAEILPLESADMYYSDVPVREWIDKTDTSKGTHVVFKSEIFAIENLRNHEVGEGDICAWSLTALFKLLPKSARLEKGNATELYRVTLPVELETSDWYIDPINACYEMILKLHELNML